MEDFRFNTSPKRPFRSLSSYRPQWSFLIQISLVSILFRLCIQLRPSLSWNSLSSALGEDRTQKHIHKNGLLTKHRQENTRKRDKSLYNRRQNFVVVVLRQLRPWSLNVVLVFKSKNVKNQIICTKNRQQMDTVYCVQNRKF